MLNKEVPAVILSGGQSRRMGKEYKAFVYIKDKTLLEIIIERLQYQAPQIAINTNSNDKKYLAFGLPILSDKNNGFLGPLAGIFTAMSWANDLGYRSVATVAVDTPLFPKNLLKRLYKKMDSTNSDIVFAESAPNLNHQKVLHPVFGLWKTHLLKDLNRELANDVRKVTLWAEKHKTSYVNFSYKKIDPFFNINAPDDIKKLKECLSIK